MPTTITKTVMPSGGDYSSLSAWEAGQQSDIVSADEIQQAECYAFEDTTQVAIDGWTTDATRYIKVYTPLSERHNCTPGTGYRIQSAGFLQAIDIFEDNVRLDGIAGTIASFGDYFIYTEAGVSGEIQISNCVAVDQQAISNKSPILLRLGGTGITAKVWNCLAYNFFGTNVSYMFALTSGTVYFYNCTAVGETMANSSALIHQNGSGTIIAKNCLSDLGLSPGLANAWVNTGSGWSGSSTNNLSSDATAPGGSAQTNVSPTYVDYANKNFRLAASDTAARNNAADLSADANLAFDIDIDGSHRASTWDIGADEQTTITIITKTVKSAGGDYSTLAAFESGEQLDLVYNDKILQAECYNFADSSHPIFDGWITDVARYIRVYTPSGERHTGITGTGYRLNPGGSFAGIIIEENDVRLEGISFIASSINAPGISIGFSSIVQANIYVDKCFFDWSAADVYYEIGVSTGVVSGKVVISNTIFWQGASGVFEAVDVSSAGCTVYLYNCTAVSTYTGNLNGFDMFMRRDKAMVAKNCIGVFLNSVFGGRVFSTGYDAASTNNVASDGTAPGSNAINGTPTFVDTGTGDLHLDSSDTVAKDQGADLSGDPLFPSSMVVTRATVATDDFNRANGALTTPWTQLAPLTGRVDIASNAIGSAFSSPAAARNEGTFSNDQWSSLALTGAMASNTGAIVGVIGRASSDVDANRDYYAAHVVDNGTSAPVVEFFKVVNGTKSPFYNIIRSGWVATDRIEIECVGTTIRALRNGEVLASVTDGDLTTGKIGVDADVAGSSDMQGDNWEGGDATYETLFADIDEDSRPQGADWDIGADEVVAGSASLTPTVGAAALAGIAGRMNFGIPTQTTLKIQ